MTADRSMLTSPDDVTTPKQRRKQKRSPIERLIRWGPWHYRFWREIARWCYEQSLHNPAVVDAALGFPAHRELLQNYDAIRRETLEIALSGRLPANHEIMEQQRTLYEFDRKAWGMLPLRGYGYNYPANQNLIPTLKSFLKRHPDVVSAAISLFPPGKILRPHKGPFKGVWRFHLPLYVDMLENNTTSCELMIDGITYHLQEREGFLWDDTFLHSAINRSEQARVVLLFDVFRQDQPFWLIGMSWVFLWVAQIWQYLQNMRERALLR